MHPRNALETAPARRRRRAPVAVALLACVALVAAACGSDEPGAAPAPGTDGPSTTEAPSTTPAPPPVWPLSGAVQTDATNAGRPALVVKIDNVDEYARPQAGINVADLVYEEKIEGPISRFAAVFHSTDAPELGPVRSGRSTDVAIVSSLNTPLYSFSGANEVMIAQLRAAPLVDIGYDVQPGSYDRRRDRKAPDNVFTSTQRLWALSPEGSGPPPQQLTYRAAGEGIPAGTGTPAATIDYNWGGGPVDQPVTFTWDAARGGWARVQKGRPHVDTDGLQIAPANVIVQFVPYVDTGLVDLSGTPVPEAQLVGGGEAWVFTDGAAVRGTWSKPDLPTPTSYAGPDGQPIGLTPGQTWIVLLPVGGAFAAAAPDGTPLT